MLFEIAGLAKYLELPFFQLPRVAAYPAVAPHPDNAVVAAGDMVDLKALRRSAVIALTAQPCD